MADNPYFPILLTVSGKPCLVVGGGTIATRKVGDLVEAGSHVTVVAETPCSDIVEMAQNGMITLHRRRFVPEDVAGMFLVYAATDDGSANELVAYAARRDNILVNVVDNPPLSDFNSGSVLKRGPLRIAVSTSGMSPSLAREIRKKLEEMFSDDFGEYVSAAGECRKQLLADISLVDEKRKRALDWLASDEAIDAFRSSGHEAIWTQLKKIIYS